MAKRKTVTRQRVSRSSGGEWKRSTPLAALLILAIVGAWVGMYWWWSGANDITLFHDFPYQYIAETEGAQPFTIRSDSDKRKSVPFKNEKGEICWEAFECGDPECPGRTADGKKAVFPYIANWKRERFLAGKPLEPTQEEINSPDFRPPEEEMPRCPFCVEAGREGVTIYPYNNDEGQKIIDETYKKMAERNAGK